MHSCQDQAAGRAVVTDDVDIVGRTCYSLWWDVTHIVDQLTLSCVLPYNVDVVDSLQENRAGLLGYTAGCGLLVCADDQFLTSCGPSAR